MKKPLSEDEIKRIFKRSKGKRPKKSRLKKSKKRKRIGLHAHVKELAKAIEKNGVLSNQKCTTYTCWHIDCVPSERLETYSHLVVLTDVTPDGKTSIKLLKVERDSGSSEPQRVMKKMVGLTGYGLILCPTISRFDKFINAYKELAEREKIVTDGIYFGLTKDVLQHGILGPTFIALDGTAVKFQPMKMYV